MKEQYILFTEGDTKSRDKACELAEENGRSFRRTLLNNF